MVSCLGNIQAQKNGLKNRYGNRMFRPLLAPQFDPKRNRDYFQRLKYPYAVSPKFDGIRCVVKRPEHIEVGADLEITGATYGEYSCLSKTLKYLPSKQVQTIFSPFHELDGEILVGNETDHDVYNRTQSYVMSHDKWADNIKFRVFDCADEEIAGDSFENRLAYAKDQIDFYKVHNGANVSIVDHPICSCYEELIEIESKILELGYEGVMLRKLSAPYKHNRATILDDIIFKLKRFTDEEVTVIGIKEGFVNMNSQGSSATGYANRSTAKDGLVPSGLLGAFIVEYYGVKLEVAAGAATHAQRREFFLTPELILGKTIVMRHFPHGKKDLPRFPRFVGFRDIKAS